MMHFVYNYFLDIFQLLNEPRFRAIDKIKTIGSTYMAAVGLMPDYKIQVTWLNS